MTSRSSTVFFAAFELRTWPTSTYYDDHRRAGELLDVPELTPAWHVWARGPLARLGLARRALSGKASGTGS